jgi:hypothetical protein
MEESSRLREIMECNFIDSQGKAAEFTPGSSI